MSEKIRQVLSELDGIIADIAMGILPLPQRITRDGKVWESDDGITWRPVEDEAVWLTESAPVSVEAWESLGSKPRPRSEGQ